MSTLKVPGATLYYEVRGSGPVLLLICGGVYDAAGYTALAERLDDRYTVVTYDRRGNSRSPLDGPDEPQRIEVHADDAYRVLSAVGVTADEPATVFGNSSGAMIALELATRHPELVRVAVAHEPPVFEYLPDRDHWRGVLDEVEQALATDGVDKASEVFSAALRMRGGDREPPTDPESLEAMARMGKNFRFFIAYEVPPFGRYAPDVEALRAADVRVVMGAGEDSKDEPPHRAAYAIGEQIGAPTVLFPGDHGGFGPHAERFAATLQEVF
jgi:pimeloyl-ACP methyl ester carboxylesterase